MSSVDRLLTPTFPVSPWHLQLSGAQSYPHLQATQLVFHRLCYSRLIAGLPSCPYNSLPEQILLSPLASVMALPILSHGDVILHVWDHGSRCWYSALGSSTSLLPSKGIRLNAGFLSVM